MSAICPNTMLGASLFKDQLQADTNIRTNPAVKNERKNSMQKFSI
jgi:hypothetical protein